MAVGMTARIAAMERRARRDGPPDLAGWLDREIGRLARQYGVPANELHAAAAAAGARFDAIARTCAGDLMTITERAAAAAGCSPFDLWEAAEQVDAEYRAEVGGQRRWR